MHADGLTPAMLAIHLLSIGPAGIDLSSAGMPGCFLNVVLPAAATFMAVPDPSGRASVSYPLPDAPLFVGDVYSQWFFHDVLAPVQPLKSYRGVRHQVRCGSLAGMRLRWSTR